MIRHKGEKKKHQFSSKFTPAMTKPILLELKVYTQLCCQQIKRLQQLSNKVKEFSSWHYDLPDGSAMFPSKLL
jgi:hypothetical protein